MGKLSSLSLSLVFLSHRAHCVVGRRMPCPPPRRLAAPAMRCVDNRESRPSTIKALHRYMDLRREAGGGGGFERVVEGGGNGYDCTEPFRRGLRCCLGPQMSKNAYFVINACSTRGGDHGAGARPRGWGGGLLCVVCGFCLGCVVGIWLTALSSLDVLL